MHSDQMRKDGISEPMIQALYCQLCQDQDVQYTRYMQCKSGDTIPCEGA